MRRLCVAGRDSTWQELRAEDENLFNLSRLGKSPRSRGKIPLSRANSCRLHVSRRRRRGAAHAMRKRGATAMRVLVGYASRFGSTREIARRIGDTIRAGGNDVDILMVDDIEDVAQYDAVVFGSGVYDGSWTPAATGLMRRHAAALARKRVWLFTVGSFGDRRVRTDHSPARLPRLRRSDRARSLAGVGQVDVQGVRRARWRQPSLARHRCVGDGDHRRTSSAGLRVRAHDEVVLGVAAAHIAARKGNVDQEMGLTEQFEAHRPRLRGVA